MKPNFLFFVALFAAVISLALTSCEGKEVGDVLTGTWTYNADAKKNGGVYESVTFSGKEDFTYETAIYTTTGEYHAGPVKRIGTYVIEGNTFTVTTHFEGDTETNVDKLEFKIENNVLTVKMLQGGTFYPEGIERSYIKQ